MERPSLTFIFSRRLKAMELSPGQVSAAKVRTVWDTFSTITTGELDILLEMAGHVPKPERTEKLSQALFVWFGGEIPNPDELARLVRKGDIHP